MTKMIFSWTEKEILNMINHNKRAWQHRFTAEKSFDQHKGSSPPFHELEREFDHWVRGLRLVLQPQINPLKIPFIRQNAILKSDQDCDADPQPD
jgi:alpha-amylase/alpha-mannosidase (GH57 family)